MVSLRNLIYNQQAVSSDAQLDIYCLLALLVCVMDLHQSNIHKYDFYAFVQLDACCSYACNHSESLCFSHLLCDHVHYEVCCAQLEIRPIAHGRLLQATYVVVMTLVRKKPAKRGYHAQYGKHGREMPMRTTHCNS